MNSRIHMYMQGTQNSPNNLEKGEKKWKIYTSWFQNLVEATVTKTFQWGKEQSFQESDAGTTDCCSVSHAWFLRPHGLQPTRLLCPWDFPAKNTGVGCHFFLQGIFLTQGLNPHLLHWQEDSLLLNHQISPRRNIYNTFKSMCGTWSRLKFQ